MAIIRNRTQQQYTNVANSIFRNKELSLRDRGLLTTLLSLPDNWRFSVMGLAEILKKDGKEQEIQEGWLGHVIFSHPFNSSYIRLKSADTFC